VPRRPVVGVIGSGAEDQGATENARRLGALLAAEGWVVLSGGRAAGVMKAVSAGAQERGGLTVGILPDPSSEVAPDVDLAIVTDLGNGRNNVIGLSSNVVIACGVDGPGTASEVALGLKNGKPVILLAAEDTAVTFFRRIAGDKLFLADTPEQAVQLVREKGWCDGEAT